MATATKRGKSYRIKVSCGYDVYGKQIIKSTTWTPEPTMTERQIEKELERQKVLFEEKCRTGQFIDNNIKFSDFIEKWVTDYAEEQLKATTIANYQGYLQRIIPALGHIRLSKLQPHHLIEFYKNLAEEGIRKDTKYKPIDTFKEVLKSSNMTQKQLADMADLSTQTIYSCTKGNNVEKHTADIISKILGRTDLFTAVNPDATLSSKTIAEHHRLLSSILSTAVYWQVIFSNPCERVKAPKVIRKEAKYLDEVQARDFAAALNTEPLLYQVAVMVFLTSGVRRGELCGLEWNDIDMKHGIIHINKSLLYLSSKGLYEDTPKTKGSDRFIYIPMDVIMLLKRLRVEQQKNRLLLGDQWKNTNKVFTTADGNYLRPDNLTTWISKFIKRHNLPKATIHTLRHTSATLLIAKGVNVKTVSSRLGHSNTTTTLNIYTHAIKSADAIASEKLNDIFTITDNYKELPG